MSTQPSYGDGRTRFGYRVAGVALDRDRILLFRAESDDFWALPGGRVELLETSAEALSREMQEELEVKVGVGRLLWVVENFFEYQDVSFQEMGLYFLMSFPTGSDIYEKTEVFEGYEEGYRLFFKWFPVNTLSEALIRPSFLSAALRSIPEAPMHVVHRGK